MSKAVKRLGRGLDSLVSAPVATAETPRAQTPAEAATVPESRQPSGGSVQLDIELLQSNPYQPRKTFDEAGLVSLAASIERSGILQPIAVRPRGDRFEIIAGERRWTAAKSLGMKTVPVVIRQANDEQMLELALIENLQREDLNPVDRARAYREFCEKFHLTPDQVAMRVGEDRSTVVNYLRLLDLPEFIQEMVARGVVQAGHARCLLKVDSAEQQKKLAEAVVRQELSVRALEDIVRTERRAAEVPGVSTHERPTKWRMPHVAELERRFEEALKTRVRIKEGKKKGTGHITIEFFTFEDFARVGKALDVELREL